MESSRGSAARIGFVIFIASLVTMAAVYIVGDGGGFLREYNRYYTYFPSSAGLRPPAKVLLNGNFVGTVEEIGFPSDLAQTSIVVTLSVRAKFAERIREDSRAWIQSENLLGDKVLAITMGTPSHAQVPPGGVIKGTDRSAIADLVGAEVATSTSELLDNLLSLLREVNAGKGTLGQFLKNPELYNNMNDFTRSLATSSNELSAVAKEMKVIIDEVHSQKGTLGKLIFSEAYAQEFTRAIQSANLLLDEAGKALEPLSKGEGSLGKLLREDGFHQEATAALSRLSSLAGRLDAAFKEMDENRSALGRFIKDPEMGSRVDRMVANLERTADALQSILDKVDRGQGTVGLLVNDPSIYFSARNLFVGVRESGLLSSTVRRAEVRGQELWAQDENRDLENGRKEIERVKKAEGDKGKATAPEPKPLPAESRESEARAVPAPVRAEGPEAPPPVSAGGTGPAPAESGGTSER